jgi:hypothetical protein
VFVSYFKSESLLTRFTTDLQNQKESVTCLIIDFLFNWSAQKQPAAQPTTTQPPRGSNQSRTPPQNEQYSSKPPPPLPRQDNNQLLSNSYESSGQRRQPSPDYRSNLHGGSGLGRQQSPLVPQQGNYAYSSSPPSNNGRFPPQQHAQARPQPQASRHPVSPAVGGGAADPTLLPLFRAVDKNGKFLLIAKQLPALQPTYRPKLPLSNPLTPTKQAAVKLPKSNSAPRSSMATGPPSTPIPCNS